MRSIDRFALSFSPILLRLALGLTFLWAGAGKLFLTTDLGPAQAATLAEIRAGAAPAAPETDAEPSQEDAAPAEALPESRQGAARNSNLRSLTDRPADDAEETNPPSGAAEEGADTDDEPNRPDPRAQLAPASGFAPGYSLVLAQDQAPEQEPDQEEAAPDDAAPEDSASTNEVTTSERMLVHVALTIHAAVHPEKGSPRLPAFMARNAIALAWAVALIEFLGGVCMILGLLARLWALGLTGVMAGVVWITHVGPASLGGMDQTFLGFLPPVWPFNPEAGMAFFWTLGLLLTAFATVFLGAGALSLDRLLFGSPNNNTFETFDENPPV